MTTWPNKYLWTGAIEWGFESGFVEFVEAGVDGSYIRRFLDMTEVGQGPLKYVVHDGRLFLNVLATGAFRERETNSILSRIALAAKSQYAVSRQLGARTRYVEAAASDVAATLIEEVIEAEGQAVLRSFDNWSYTAWRSSVELVREDILRADPSAFRDRDRARVVCIMPARWFRPLVANFTPSDRSFGWAKEHGHECHGMGDTHVIVSNSVKSPLFMPDHAVDLMRNHYYEPASEVRIVAFPNPSRIGMAVRIIDRAVTDEPDFDGDSFQARRAARMRNR